MLAVLIGFLMLVSTVCLQAADVQSSNVRFGPGNQYNGYLARPTGDGPFPGLVVIHEWWGLNDNIRAESDKLAKAGYVALAVDLFGRSTTNMQEAVKMVNSLDQKAATTEMLAAANYLRSQRFVRPDHVGSIGWCFGGRQSLILAINDPKLRAAVIYYGNPITDTKELSKIHAAILGIYGESDESIPMDKVKQFQKALTDLRITNEFVTYSGAGHAFANPSGGERYKPKQSADAWARTLAFLNKYLK